MDVTNIITLIKKYDIDYDEKNIIDLFVKYPKIVSKYVNIYTVLTTYPAHKSGNVGDKLITASFKGLIKFICTKHNKRVYFYEFFRKHDLKLVLHHINNTKGIIMPGFAIRLNMYDCVYKLTSNLNKIKVPYIPVGSGECTIPTTVDNIITNSYNKGTIRFLKYIASHSPAGIGCRDPLVMKQLTHNGINNIKFVGDCAYYDPNMIHKPLKYSGSINTVVFTEPHNGIYEQQTYKIIDLIVKLFPKAKKLYSMHSIPNKFSVLYRKYTSARNFKIIQSYKNKNLNIYKNCDLHIGYNVHEYIKFVRFSMPAILFIEDDKERGHTQSFNNTSCLEALIQNTNTMIPHIKLLC